MNFNDYYNELKRRNVFKAALAYLVVAWLIIQVVSIIFPVFGVPDSLQKGIIILLAIGFPIWLVFSWVYEVTPTGIKKTENVQQNQSITKKTSERFNKLILGALVIAIVLLGVNLYSNYSANYKEGSQNKSTTADTKDLAGENETKSIAVLAFEDMSQQKDQEYFSDGVSEEILNFLAKNPDLKVISRTSSFSYKGKDVRVTTIGKELGVNYILEGSVRKSGSMLRITAQLINTETGNHMWSETYDREMDDIFKIQDDIAGNVTKNLEARLLGRKIQAVDPEAYNKYLKAKSLRAEFTIETVTKANELIEQAIAIDSGYAPIWFLKAKIESNLFSLKSKILSEKESNNIRKYANKAIELDPEYADPYVLLGYISKMEGNFEAYRDYIEKALSLDKNNSTIWLTLSTDPTIPLRQRFKLLDKAMATDPLYYSNYHYLSILYFEAGNYNKALEAINTYLSHYPNAAQAYSFKAELLGLLGNYEEALVALEKETVPFSKMYVKPLIFVGKGDRSKALQAGKEFKKEYGERSDYFMVQFYAYLNEKKEAYKWLEKAVEDQSPELSQIKSDPYLNNLRGEKRFQELVKRADVPEVKPLNLELE